MWPQTHTVTQSTEYCSVQVLPDLWIWPWQAEGNSPWPIRITYWSITPVKAWLTNQGFCIGQGFWPIARESVRNHQGYFQGMCMSHAYQGVTIIQNPWQYPNNTWIGRSRPPWCDWPIMDPISQPRRTCIEHSSHGGPLREDQHETVLQVLRYGMGPQVQTIVQCGLHFKMALYHLAVWAFRNQRMVKLGVGGTARPVLSNWLRKRGCLHLWSPATDCEGV